MESEKSFKERLAFIAGDKSLPRRSYPQLPVLIDNGMSMNRKLRVVQNFIEEFEYNFTNVSTFCPAVATIKSRSMAGITQVAKQIAKQALPIKCLEAVALGVYVTCQLPSLMRLPLRFKSIVNNRCHWHIVLLTYCDGKYGSLGLSRQSSLGYRTNQFDSAIELIDDFLNAYRQCGHQVKGITIGLPFPHNPYSRDDLFWHFLSIPIGLLPRDQFVQVVGAYFQAPPQHLKELVQAGRQTPSLHQLARFDSNQIRIITQQEYDEELYRKPSILRLGKSSSKHMVQHRSCQSKTDRARRII